MYEIDFGGDIYKSGVGYTQKEKSSRGKLTKKAKIIKVRIERE